MKLFKVDDTHTIVCDWKKTRNGFKHEATLLRNGYEVDSTKICYLNRTWEAYEYQSVILKLLDNNFKDEERQKFVEEFKYGQKC